MSKSKNIKKPVVKKVESVIPIAKDKEGTIVKQEVKKQETIKSKKIEAGKKNLEKGKWKPGKSGNPKGRTPKSFTSFAKQIQKEGYEKVTIDKINEAYQNLLGLDRERIVKVANDHSQPYVLCEVAKKMVTGGFDVIEKVLDRVHGKPKQAIEQSGELNLTLASGLLALRKNKQRDEI